MPNIFVSVNFNYGEHERNRIKRKDKILSLLQESGIEITDFNRLSYVFTVQQMPPKSINRLARVWQDDNNA